MAWIKWILGAVHWKWWLLLAHPIFIALVFFVGPLILPMWIAASGVIIHSITWIIQLFLCFAESNKDWDDTAQGLRTWYQKHKERLSKWWASRPGQDTGPVE